MAMTYKEVPENNIYYLTFVMDSTPLRAIQAASNALQLLASGFTVIRDVGNNAMYADTALRAAIEQGWMPGPTIIPSGLIIGDDRRAVHADAGDVQAAQTWSIRSTSKPTRPMKSSRPCARTCCSARRTIKICVDCKPWGYSVDDIKLFIAEAAKGGAKVDGHVQTRDGGQRAIDAGIHVISHGQQLTPEQHAQMAKKAHVPRQHRHAVHRVSRVGGRREARGDAAQERVGEGRAHHLLDRHGLLERADEEAGRRRG